VVIGAFDLQWVTALALGDPRLIRTLPAAYRRMASGDFTDIAPIVAACRARAGIESAMKQAMDTSSGATPDRRSLIAQQAAASLLGNAINFPAMYLERAWGVSDLGEAFREPVVSDVPTLVLVGDLDPRTPVENGREILATLRHGRLVTIENATHQFDVFGSAAIRDLLRRFLTGALRDDEHVVLPPIIE
jgi:pimeloyl-ACP methyl ester carboxylesterase